MKKPRDGALGVVIPIDSIRREGSPRFDASAVPERGWPIR